MPITAQNRRGSSPFIAGSSNNPIGILIIIELGAAQLNCFVRHTEPCTWAVNILCKGGKRMVTIKMGVRLESLRECKGRRANVVQRTMLAVGFARVADLTPQADEIQVRGVVFLRLDH